MIPRFSNPHLLPQFTETVPRSEIYALNDKDTNKPVDYDPDLLNQLKKCLEYALSQPDLEVSGRRDALEESVSKGESYEEPILFRLVSSALSPLPISLLPLPPPPPITREPDAEDSEEQALLRKQRAEAASVVAETILHESKTDKFPRHFDKRSKPLQHLRAVSGYTRTSIMIIRKLQQHRKTRPPVPLSNLSHFPYVPNISTMSLPPIKSRAMDCPVIDAEDPEATPKRSRPRRRKRGAETKERSPPQFWRPNPALIGKCRGYAYGYPSNLACRSETESWKYKRDSMKRAAYVE